MHPISNNTPSVLIAMSGGVDSTLATALLRKDGYEVHGVTFLMHEAGAQTLLAARIAAENLKILLIEKDAREAFQDKVMAPFLDSYLHGLTPNPCLLCNPMVKFHSLISVANEMNIRYVATGHYVRAYLSPYGRWAIQRATVRRKDQSYALAGLHSDQVSRCLFPLGTWNKDDVRAEAKNLGLEAAQRDDSQDICFLPEGDYAAYLRNRGITTGSGPIVDCGGRILGKHAGLEGYTVGQRKGLGIAAERPMYVLSLNPERNELVVGFEEETYSSILHAGPVNWMALDSPKEPFECHVQIRYRHEAAHARVIVQKDKLVVEFIEPQRSVTPGQWVVGYDENGYILFGAPILPH